MDEKNNLKKMDVLQAGIQAIHWMGQKGAQIKAVAALVKEGLGADPIQTDTLLNHMERITEDAELLLKARQVFIGAEIRPVMRPAMLADVVQSAAFHCEVPDEQLTIQAAPDTPLAWTDSSQLAMALYQIFKNAQEAGAGHISANITPTLDGRFVAMSVADDGPGIPIENHGRVWEEFYTTKGSEHPGLGLSAAMFAIGRVGGRITLDSDEGRGAVFTIILPASAEDDAVDLSHAPNHIFFVDEMNDGWANFAANVLKLADKDVIVQESPAGAAAADLILVDEALTTMPVEDVLTDLKIADLSEKTVVMTAWMSPERSEKYMRLGAKDVALKPYTFSGLSAFLDFESPAGEG